MVLSLERWIGKVAIVTGAASGSGAAIAKQLVEAGVIVAAIDINAQDIEKVSGKKGQLHPIKVDLTKEEDILKAFEWIKKNLGPIHILVNCAGYGRPSSILDQNTDSWRKVFDTNVMGLCITTREAVNDMKANNTNGHIIHINSVLGHSASTANYGVYPGSKFAVTALAEVLRIELEKQKLKIKVTSVSPGLVESGLTTKNKELSSEEIEQYFGGREMLKPEDIADGVIYALSTSERAHVKEVTITQFFK